MLCICISTAVSTPGWILTPASSVAISYADNFPFSHSITNDTSSLVTKDIIVEMQLANREIGHRDGFV